MKDRRTNEDGFVNDDEIDALEKLLATITRGAWSADGGLSVRGCGRPWHLLVATAIAGVPCQEDYDNMAFIALARNLLPAMLCEIKARRSHDRQAAVATEPGGHGTFTASPTAPPPDMREVLLALADTIGNSAQAMRGTCEAIVRAVKTISEAK